MYLFNCLRLGAMLNETRLYLVACHLVCCVADVLARSFMKMGLLRCLSAGCCVFVLLFVLSDCFVFVVSSLFVCMFLIVFVWCHRCISIGRLRVFSTCCAWFNDEGLDFGACH